MNILQINTLDKKGGAAKVAYSLKLELEKRGHTTSMFVGRKYSDDTNIKILNDIGSFSSKIRKKLAFYLANDIDFFSSDHILKTEEFKNADIIHCHNLHTNYFNLGTLKKISALKPVVWTLHDMWPITAHCGHAFDGRLKGSGFFTCPSLDIPPAIAWHNEKYLEKKKRDIYENSKFHIVTPSQWLADKVGQSVLKTKKTSVIYNGIDTSIFRTFDKQECRRHLDLPADKRIILIVAKGGVLNPWKGGDYAQKAIKALKNDPRAYFVDLGGDSDSSANNVRTVSFIKDQGILAKYYSAADIILYPSLADNCPLVVLEAMACGLPIVAFDTGGIPELVEHRTNGYIAKYRDADDLQAGIIYLLNLSAQETEKMGQYSINKTHARFTVGKMTDQYIELYEKIKTPERG